MYYVNVFLFNIMNILVLASTLLKQKMEYIYWQNRKSYTVGFWHGVIVDIVRLAGNSMWLHLCLFDCSWQLTFNVTCLQLKPCRLKMTILRSNSILMRLWHYSVIWTDLAREVSCSIGIDMTFNNYGRWMSRNFTHI